MQRLTIQQIISAPGWWNQISLLAFLDLTCLKIRIGAHDSHLSKSLLPWWISVGWYIILYYAKTDNLAGNFRSKMARTEVPARLLGLLQDLGWGTCQSSVEIMTAFAQFSRLINYFVQRGDWWWYHRVYPLRDDSNRCPCFPFWLASGIKLTSTRVICEGHHRLDENLYGAMLYWTFEVLIIKQIHSTLRWRQSVSFSTLLTPFSNLICQCKNHISRSLLPWSNLVRQPTLQTRHYLSFIRLLPDWDVGWANNSTICQNGWRWGRR